MFAATINEMLKRISHIIIAMLIVASTMGLTVSMHYCGNNLESVSVLSSPEPCCDIPDDCCHDETININTENDFSGTFYNFDFSQMVVELPALVELFLIDIPEDNSFISDYFSPPPPKIQTVLSSLQSYLL